jgi:hypothetical protein
MVDSTFRAQDQDRRRLIAGAICRVVADCVPFAWGAFEDDRTGGVMLSSKAADCVRRMLKGEAVAQETFGMNAPLTCGIDVFAVSHGRSPDRSLLPLQHHLKDVQGPPHAHTAKPSSPRLPARFPVLPAAALRGNVLPECRLAADLPILRDREPPKPEVRLSPLRGHCQHRTGIESAMQGATRSVQRMQGPRGPLQGPNTRDAADPLAGPYPQRRPRRHKPMGCADLAAGANPFTARCSLPPSNNPAATRQSQAPSQELRQTGSLTISQSLPPQEIS